MVLYHGETGLLVIGFMGFDFFFFFWMTEAGLEA